MSARERAVQSLFDAEAVRYDANYDAPTASAHVVRARLATALRLLGDGPGEVLDVGMGPGRLLEALERAGWTVSGVDPSDAMVALARARVPRAAERLLNASAESLPFPDAAFDATAMTGTLEYVEDLPRAVGELARVLRPGGRAALSFPHFRSPHGYYRRYLYDPGVRAVKRVLPFRRPAPIGARRPLGRRAVEGLLEQAGLRIDTIEYVGFRLPPLDLVAPRQLVSTSRRLEATRPWLGPLLAGQLVFGARRPS